MAKRRKTREQKKLADQRHNFAHSLATTSNFEAKISLPSKTIQSSSKLAKTQTVTNEYPFLLKDLTKTAILTGAILSFQIILFILLKHHSFVIPGLTY